MTYSGLEPHADLEAELLRFKLHHHEHVARLLLNAGADPRLGPDSCRTATRVLELLLKDPWARSQP